MIGRLKYDGFWQLGAEGYHLSCYSLLEGTGYPDFHGTNADGKYGNTIDYC